MKIFVRYLGLILLEKELKPGEYTLGREKDCDLPLAHQNISRQHGRIYHENDEWFYQDLRENAKSAKSPQKLSAEKPIDLGHGIELLTETQLWEGNTEISKLHDLSHLSAQLRHNRKNLIWLAGAFSIFILGAILISIHSFWKKPMDPNELLAFVRPKIVEFEHLKDQRLINDLKKYANLKDEDFQDRAGFCSGFIVAPNVILTAFHCIRGNQLAEINDNFQIRTHDGKLFKPRRVLGFDFKRDFLFLEVTGLAIENVLRFSQDYKIGEKVYTVGNVGGEGIAIREGIMASTTPDPNDPNIEYLRYSAPASPGNSGGPLINSYGEVVGLVFARSFAENYNVGTASEHLVSGKKQFVEKSDNKKVLVNFEGYLDFSTEELLLTFGYPYLPAWEENQEYPRMFQKTSFEVDVPSEYNSFSRQFSTECNQGIKKKYGEVLATMEKAKEREGRWTDLFTGDFKVLFAPDYFDSMS
ncbi:MAG: trypsin-like peptidase domain-containing protein, partial [Bdellovibrionales bacterium]|nr:trypsin-like peptidase domain-containing protein [Bdellovibrionales bacterium]